MSHNLARFALNFAPEKKKNYNNVVCLFGTTVMFIWKQCERVHSIVLNAAQNQQMYSVFLMGELFLVCCRYF